MGSRGWCRCYWCWDWGWNLGDADGLGPLCDGCFDRLIDRRGPPWHPTATERRKQELSLAFGRRFPESVVEVMASFDVPWWEP